MDEREIIERKKRRCASVLGIGKIVTHLSRHAKARMALFERKLAELDSKPDLDK